MSTVIAITGGVAAGKSRFADRFLEQVSERNFSVVSFSCDAEVSKLLTDPKIVGRLNKCSEGGVLDDAGSLERSKLRDLVFENSKFRKKVEEILHPPVLDVAMTFVENSKKNDFIALEIPLLYEVDFPIPRDVDLVIGCSKQTQIRRMRDNRGITNNLATKFLDAQMSIQEKIDRSDFVIWNDGSLESFDDQIERFTEFILSNFGS